MKQRYGWARLIGVALLGAFACGPAEVPLVCAPTAGPADLVLRASPYDSTMVSVGSLQSLICYGRPFARDREIFGSLIPYDTLWRTGANEPTIIHIPFEAEMAGLRLRPGKYSIYTVPNPDNWQLVINSSTTQWGLTMEARGVAGNLFPNAYTKQVRDQEVGRTSIEPRLIDHVEQFTIRDEPHTNGETEILLEWATTQIRIPFRAIRSEAESQ